MSSSTPSKPKSPPVPSRRNTFFSLGRDKKTPPVSSDPNADTKASKDAVVTAPKKASPKPSPSPKPPTVEATSTPAKSKLAQIGGSLRRTPSQASIRLKKTPSVVSLAKGSDSASTQGATASSAATQSRPPTSRSGSTSESVAAKSRFGRMGQALRRTPSQVSLKLNKSPSTTSLREANSASSKVVTTPPISTAESVISQGKPPRSETAPVPAKSRLARIGGALTRTPSLLTSKLTRSSSSASSAKGTDSSSLKEAAAKEPATVLVSSAPSQHDTPHPSIVADTAVQEVPHNDEPSVIPEPLVVATPQPELEVSIQEAKQLSPVLEDAPQSMLDSTLAGAGGFTDEPVEAPESWVVMNSAHATTDITDAQEPTVVSTEPESAPVLVTKEDIPVSPKQEDPITLDPTPDAEVTAPDTPEPVPSGINALELSSEAPASGSIAEHSLPVKESTAKVEDPSSSAGAIEQASATPEERDIGTDGTEKESPAQPDLVPIIANGEVLQGPPPEIPTPQVTNPAPEPTLSIPTSAPAPVSQAPPSPPVSSTTTNGGPRTQLRVRAMSVKNNNNHNTSTLSKHEQRNRDLPKDNTSWSVLGSLYSLIFSSLETVRWALTRWRRSS